MTETVFGMTLEDVGRIKKSVVEWLDGEHPQANKSDGGDFANAFTEGAKMLHDDKMFANIFNGSCSPVAES